MSFLVHIYNQDSGWKIGELLSTAEHEAEAITEAAEHYGVTGLQQFRYVANAVEVEKQPEPQPEIPSTTSVTEPSPSALNTPPTVVETPHVETGSVSTTADTLSEIKALLSKLLGG